MTPYIIALILSIISASPVHAAPLTRGNVFAESLAGCSLGIALNLAILVVTPDLTLATTSTNRVTMVQCCVTGGILAATIYGIIELSNFSEEIFDPHGVTTKKIPMIYPETPGREH